MEKYKKEIMEAYYNTVSKRTVEGDGLEVGMFVEDTNGQRFVVEKISTNYDEVKDFDKSGQAASWIKHNSEINEGQEWIAVKDAYGVKSVERYCDTGVTKVVEQSFDSKPDHVKTDYSIMEAFAQVLEGKKPEEKEEKCCCGKDADSDKDGKCKKCGCGCEVTEDATQDK